MTSVSEDLDPRSAAVIAYAAEAVEIASTFDTLDPRWFGAATLCMGDQFLRDLLLAQMIAQASWDRAVPALGQLDKDRGGNRDASIAAALWLSGNTETALAVADLATGNRLAELIPLMIMASVPAYTWGNKLQRTISAGTGPKFAPALKPRPAAKEAEHN